MVSSMSSLRIWIGILRSYETLYKWGWPKKWGTPVHIAICRKSFPRLGWSVRNGTIRFDNDVRKMRHKIRVEGQVLPLPPNLPPPLRIPQEPLLEQWLDIRDWHLWTSAQAEGGFPWRKGPRDLWMEDVYTVVGSTTGLQSVRQGRRLRRLRRLERS